MEKFTRILMKWHAQANTREMPWKGEKDPYKIWLSEVILQQTRVAQGMQYYLHFTEQYPTIGHLAGADDRQVFKSWEGLGYYNRCRNLLLTARQIVSEQKGVFPADYETILALKGVGPYTAAAIASFAYNLPYAVVDGNVFRVLARFFGIETAIDSTEGKNFFAGLAQKMLAPGQAALYNQAIMDFGAVVCKPFSPTCSTCPLQKHCVAFREGQVNHLPVKEKNLQRKHRWFYYFVFEHKGKLLVHQRTGKDIWQSLFEFYLLESGDAVKWDEKTIQSWLKEQLAITGATVLHISPVSVQQLTHQQIKGQFIRIRLETVPPFLQKYPWQPLTALRALPFPKFITQYLETPHLQKSLF
jgi:A/G-specific adenine glycosylase